VEQPMVEQLGVTAMDYQQQPWWTKFFVQVGAWCALALFLIAATFGWMRTPMQERMERIEFNAWQQTAILRAMCYQMANEAKAAAMNCDPWKLMGQ
jgi:hypothetical protein